MKYAKVGFAVVISLSVLFTGLTAWAAPVTLWQIPQTVAIDEIGFKMEAPAKVSDRAVNASVEVLDYSKIVPVDFFYVTRAVNIKMVDVDKTVLAHLSKPVRLTFSFDYIDFKRAGRLNTSLSVGHFRIGYWDASQNNWVQLPSQVFWNGSKGAVEAETDRGTGQYALIWSYREDTQLSPIAPEGIRLMINMSPVKSDVASYIEGGRTMVPLRVIAENLDARVEWNASENRVDLIRNVDKIQLWLGEQVASVNNKPFLMDVAPKVVNDRTFVPLRFVAESLGTVVTWDELTKTVKIIKY